VRFRRSPVLASMVVIVASVAAIALATPQKRPNSERSWDYTLDVVFEGPAGFVKFQDGHVMVYVADVETHDYAFVKGLSDCELTGTDYRFDLPPSVFDSTPDPNLKNNLNIPWNNTIQIDPAGLHYASFYLPQPYQIKAAHVDPTAVSDKPFPSSGPEPPYVNYQTSIVLRYKMQASDPPITISTIDPSAPIKPCKGSSPSAVLSPQIFDNEHFLKVGVGPDVEDDTNHTHATHAFKGEVAMFPALKRYAKFPMPTRFRATDCRAPVILITDAP
jgi:hypothetical protein